MAALNVGATAPDFSLPLMDGNTFSLKAAVQRGPVVLAFFKISCPVCQFTFPYLERLYRGLNGKGVTLIGISQNTKEDTASFNRQYGVTFPVALDDRNKFPVSNAYGLTNVPTLFYIDQDSRIGISSVGWARFDIDDIARKAADHASLTAVQVFSPNEQVPDFKAG